MAPSFRLVIEPIIKDDINMSKRRSARLLFIRLAVAEADIVRIDLDLTLTRQVGPRSLTCARNDALVVVGLDS